MQCVILAAGKGTRLRPLTDTTPKPLLQVAGRPILDWIVASLPAEIDEIILVTGYLEEQIKAHCGQEFYGRKVTYVHQAEQKGTAHGLWLCQQLLRNKFLFMFADDLHGAADLQHVVTESRALLAHRSDTPERFGVVEQQADGTLAKIVEKPAQPSTNLVSTGVMVLDTNIFACSLPEEKSGELYLTDVLNEYIEQYPVQVVEQTDWLPIGYPEDIVRAEAWLNRL